VRIIYPWNVKEENMPTDNYLEQIIPSIYTCIKCRGCIASKGEYKPVCPMQERFGFFSYSAGGMICLARALYEGVIDYSSEMAEVVYACTTCRACAEQCRNIYYLTNEYFSVPHLVEKIREELINRGKVPSLVRDYLKSIDLYGNPYQKPGNKRGQWAEGTGIPSYSGQDVLFYVGDEGSFDERGIKTAQAVGLLLMESGVSLGILGHEEISDGNEVKTLGESGLFELLAEKNIQKFTKLGVKKIVTLSPHGYNSIKVEYKKMGGDFEVFHYTQLLSKLIEEGKWAPPRLKAKVTYHDPCYLGRYNQEYDAPRKVLQSIQGLELIEMGQIKEEAFCCGGGGGNFFTSMLGSGENSPSRIRIRQAHDTGAEVLAVACPVCAKMLDDAVKDEGLEEKLKVRDIAEIIREAYDPLQKN
jgi:Fe-S oxidoreductase